MRHSARKFGEIADDPLGWACVNGRRYAKNERQFGSRHGGNLTCAELRNLVCFDKVRVKSDSRAIRCAKDWFGESQPEPELVWQIGTGRSEGRNPPQRHEDGSKSAEA